MLSLKQIIHCSPALTPHGNHWYYTIKSKHTLTVPTENLVGFKTISQSLFTSPHMTKTNKHTDDEGDGLNPTQRYNGEKPLN